MSDYRAFFQRNDWSEYVYGARHLLDHPDVMQKEPLKIKLKGMSATYEYYTPFTELQDRATSFHLDSHADPTNGTRFAKSVWNVRHVAYRDETNEKIWFRDLGPAVQWDGKQRNDEEPMRLMLMLSREKWPDEPLIVNGSRNFKRALYAVAYEQGIPIAGKEFELYSNHRDMDRSIARQEMIDLKEGISAPRRSPALGL